MDLELGLFWGVRPGFGPILGGLDLDLGGTGLDLIFIWGAKPGFVPNWGGKDLYLAYFRGSDLDLDLFSGVRA